MMMDVAASAVSVMSANFAMVKSALMEASAESAPRVLSAAISMTRLTGAAPMAAHQGWSTTVNAGARMARPLSGAKMTPQSPLTATTSILNRVANGPTKRASTTASSLLPYWHSALMCCASQHASSPLLYPGTVRVPAVVSMDQCAS